MTAASPARCKRTIDLFGPCQCTEPPGHAGGCRFNARANVEAAKAGGRYRVEEQEVSGEDFPQEHCG